MQIDYASRRCKETKYSKQDKYSFFFKELDTKKKKTVQKLQYTQSYKKEYIQTFFVKQTPDLVVCDQIQSEKTHPTCWSWQHGLMEGGRFGRAGLGRVGVRRGGGISVRDT